MEKSLKCIVINRSELEIEHQLDADVLFLLETVYQYGVCVINLNGSIQTKEIVTILKSAGYGTEESLLIAAKDKTLQHGKEAGLAVVAMLNEEHSNQTYEAADILVEGFEEVDFFFLERIYQRKHEIPWRVIETKRCYLREMTIQDLDELYEIYAGKGMTDYIEPLYEDRAEEEAYTKAYIKNMYGYYGYGMWLVFDRTDDKMIGRAGLNNQEIKKNIELEMGYLIRKEYQGQGYAKEVCGAIIAYAKEALEFETVNCLVENGNEKSIHLLKQMGFIEKEKIALKGKKMKRYVYLL